MKMKNREHEQATKKEQLKLHLDTNFYPPLPEFFKLKFVEVFEKYWSAGGVGWLQASLDKIGYKGSLADYNFYMFLNDEDVYCD